MTFTPRNRHILVDLIEESRVEGDTNESFTGVLLPEDYKPMKKEFVTARVKEVSPDCSVGVGKGDKIVINNSMIQEVSIDQESVNIILENYVLGVVTRDR